jgi:hypothetical protein
MVIGCGLGGWLHNDCNVLLQEFLWGEFGAWTTPTQKTKLPSAHTLPALSSFSFNVARLDRELEIKAEEAMVETN